jgi:Tol biopolymer transport system component
MSPEQAHGLPVDKRTDIWAFGCLLFEMLTAKRAFAGNTIPETIEAVLERQPDWTALPVTTPDGIRRLLWRCLEKDRQRRLHDIADARIEIEDLLQTREEAARPSGAGRTRKRLLGLSAILVLAAGAATLGWWLRAVIVSERPTLRVTRSTWVLPGSAALSSAPAVSPDGQHIAFTASTKGQPPRLFLRSFSTLEARSIAGTDGAEHPFWSPDSRSVGYFARNRLLKVAVEGGGPVEICATRAGRGGTWSRNGVIVFAPDLIDSGLAWVSADGGALHPATLLDRTQGENSHRWPVFLPDGIHFLYSVRSIRADRRGVYLGRVDRAAATPGAPLFRSENEAQYVSLTRDAGVLVSAANGHLEVRGFDPRQLRLNRDPTTLDVAASGLGPYHASLFSASPDILIHLSSPIPYGQRFASVDRDGERLNVREDRKVLNWPRLSPDGSRILYQEIDAAVGSPDLLVEDLERGNRLKLTKDGGAGLLPVWSPDGQRLAYVTGTVATSTLVIGSADGTGTVATVPCPALLCYPTDWSSAGLLVTVRTGDQNPAPIRGPADVWILSTASGETSRPLLAESFVERDARFSPDGRLVAYVSEETGRPEVSIQRVDGTPARDVISVGGGDQPVWGRNGRELFFVDPQGALRSVPVARGPNGRPVFGKAVVLDVPPIGSGHFSTQYDVSPDGRRIYFFDRRREPAPTEVGIVLGWRALLK